MSSQQSIDDFREQLYQNWSRGEEPCATCPNRVPKRKIHPTPGRGNVETEVMLVGLEPRPRNREFEVSSDDSDDLDPDIIKQLSQIKENAPTSFFNQEISSLRGRDGPSQTMVPTFISQGLHRDLEDLYYTNAKKCPNVKNRDNSKARSKCRPYLGKEIDLIKPKVIVPFGNKSTSSTFDIFDLSNDKGITSLTLNCFRNEEPYIIPAIHWSNAGTNVSRWVEGYKSEKEYWLDLAEMVNSLI